MDLTAHPRDVWHHAGNGGDHQGLAFNQGFYNLFLAIVTAVGMVAVFTGHRAVGAALVFAGVGSMLAAAAVLLVSSPDKARAAATQGTFPLIAIVLLVIGLTM